MSISRTGLGRLYRWGVARIRRTAKNEKVPEPPTEGERPEIVVHDPVPTPHPEQTWSLQSYPFYEPVDRP